MVRFQSSVLAIPIFLLAAGLLAGQGSYRISTAAGGGASNGDGGLATLAVLQQAEGIAVDSLGYLYVADAAGHRVRRISPAGIIDTVAGTGVAGYSGDNGPADVAQLNAPYGIAVDAARTLYIADLGNHCIRRIGADGRITTVAGGGSTPLSVVSDGQPAIGVQLKSPRNLVADTDGSIVFSDFDAHRVGRISVTGALSIVAGTGLAGAQGDGAAAANAQLNAPAGLALDGMGTLYIADSGNKRVRRVTRGVIDTVTVSGKALALVSPAGVAVDAAGVLYIADAAGGQCLRVPPAGSATPLKVDARDVAFRNSQLWISGSHEVWQWLGAAPKLIAGNGTANWFGDGLSATKARLSSPAAIASDASGNIYFADEANNCVRRIDASGVIATIAGAGQAGFSGDGGPATSARLQGPTGVALDRFGNLYVSDTGNHRLRRVARSGVITTVAGTGVAGALGDGGSASTAQLSSPAGLAADRDGAIYIADSGNNCIRKISTAGLIDTVAGNKTAGFSGDGGSAIRAQLNNPTGLALDPNGALLIADTNNHAIRRIDAAGVISSIADVLPSRWNAPQGVVFGANGEIWVADTGNARVAVVSPRGDVATVAGGGQNNVDSDRPALSASLPAPRGLAFDPSGALLLSDQTANRIFRITPTADEAVSGPPVPQPSKLTFRLVHAASYLTTALAPGEIVTLFGDGIGPSTPTIGAAASNGVLQTQMEGHQVLFDGLAAPIFYGRPDQITVQVPYALNGRSVSEASLVVQGVKRGSLTLPVADTAPALFTISGGAGPAAALNQDGSLNSAVNPAQAGSIITLYATGEGQTAPGGQDGRPANAPYPAPVAPVSVYLGGQLAEVLWAGSAPGMIGVLQINVRVPDTLASRGAAEVMLVAGQASSPPGVTVAVR